MEPSKNDEKELTVVKKGCKLMKKVNRWISLLLIGCMVLSMPLTSVAAAQGSGGGVDYIDITEALSLSSAEINKYRQYTVTLPQSLSSGTPQNLSANDILSISTLTITEKIGNANISLFTSSQLPAYLYKCSEVVEIMETEDIVYITYQTINDETVYLTFSNNGLVDQVIYDAADDTAYILSDECSTKIVNFRYGSSEIISEELLNTIKESIISGDYSEIQNNPCLSVDVDDLGQVMIAPKADRVSRSGVVGFTNEAELLQNLKGDFPVLNKKVTNNTSVYCDYFNKNISFHGVDSRSQYVRERADYRLFAASTLVTVIGAFLSVTTGGALTILDKLGIAIVILSGKQAIQESVKLYGSASYEYYFERYGLLYDSTRFNDYVVLANYSGFGTFCGGYDSSDRFTWIRNPSSAPEKKSWNEIQRTCVINYNAELTTYGYCERYYPLGWFN